MVTMQMLYYVKIKAIYYRDKIPKEAGLKVQNTISKI